jgi:hypothetical protein
VENFSRDLGRSICENFIHHKGHEGTLRGFVLTDSSRFGNGESDSFTTEGTEAAEVDGVLCATREIPPPVGESTGVRDDAVACGADWSGPLLGAVPIWLF